MIFSAFQAIPRNPGADRLIGMQWSLGQINEPESTRDQENKNPKTDRNTRGE
jgi:hypothetical protein